MLKKKVLLSALFLISISGTTVSLASCSGGPNVIEPINGEPYQLRKDDAAYVQDILPKLGIEKDLTTIKELNITSDDKEIATVVGQRIFGTSEGSTSISILDGESEVVKFDIEITSYNEFSDIEERLGNCSYGGALVDFFGGHQAAIVNESYQFTFTPKATTDGSTNFSVSFGDPSIASFEDIDGTYYLNALKVGNTSVKFTDNDGLTVLLFVLKVRPALSTNEEYTYYLTKFDYWGGEGFFDGWYREDSTKLIFAPDGTGTMSGKDGNTAFDTITFNYEVDSTMDDTSEYMFFKITNFQSTNASFSMTYIRFFKTGDRIMTYAGKGENSYLLELYLPKMNAN